MGDGWVRTADGGRLRGLIAAPSLLSGVRTSKEITMRRPARVFAVGLVLGCAGVAAARAQRAAQAPAQPAARQVAAAVLALPESMRAGATVLGYDAQGRLTRLRQGTNRMTCLADDSRDDRFHVACYHDSLEPFMARGRELRAQGVEANAVESTRNADVAAGRIRMPAAAALYSLTAPAGGYDPATGAVRGGRHLFVVYVPMATEASTGISATPRGNGPWLMDPGSPKAHIMFTGGM